MTVCPWCKSIAHREGCHISIISTVAYAAAKKVDALESKAITKDEFQEVARELAKEFAAEVVKELRKPRFGWNSTGSSWVRARGDNADTYTDDPHIPPDIPTRNSMGSSWVRTSDNNSADAHTDDPVHAPQMQPYDCKRDSSRPVRLPTYEEFLAGQFGTPWTRALGQLHAAYMARAIKEGAL